MATLGDSSYYAGSIVEQIAAAEAIVHLPEANVVLPLVVSLGQDKADTITVPVWNQGTNKITSGDMGAHTEGSDATAKALNSDKKTGTLDVYSFYLPVELEAEESSLENIAQRIGQIGGAAVGAKIDALITALFSGFTGNEAGTSTVALTVDMWFEALSKLKVDGAPAPYNAVLNPAQIWGTYGLSNDIATSNQFGGSPIKQDEMLSTGGLGTLAGVGIYSTNEVAQASDASEGLMFSKEAMAFGYVNPLIRVEHDREKKKLRDDFVFSMNAVAWELVDNYGCTLHSKVS